MFISVYTDSSNSTPSETLDCHEAPKHFHGKGNNFSVSVSCLRPDMVLCNWLFKNVESVRFRYSKPVFRFSLQLFGTVESKTTSQNDLLRQVKQVELRYLKEGDSEFLFRGKDTSHWIDLFLQPNFFRVALPDETDLLPPMIASILEDESLSVAGVCQNLTPDQLMAINQIHNNVFEGATKSIYLKSKCLEILSLFFAQQTFAQQGHRALGDRDIRLIQMARAKLQSSVTEPPTLPELAKHVGLSESKLKRGFKALYNQSVFGFFRSYRMEFARKLLFEQKGNVSVVAAEVGYTNISHFSAAFAQHHGVKPSTYLRQIKSNDLNRQREGN